MSRRDWRCAILVVVACSSFGCTGHSVTRVPKGTQLEDQQVYYALPQTVLALEVPVTKETRLKARCADVMTREFTPTGSQEKTTFENFLELELKPEGSKFTTGEMALATRAEPDLDQIFQIKVNGSALKKNSVVMKLSEAGLLISGTSESRNRTVELGVGIVKSLAGIAGSLIARGETEGLTNQQLQELFGSCVKSAEKIREIRKQRKELLDRAATTGVPSADTLKMLLEPGTTLEASLLQDFTGKVDSTTGKVLCDVRPKLEDFNDPKTKAVIPGEKPTELFKFSKGAGVELIDKDNCRVPQSLAGVIADPKDAVTVRLIVGLIEHQYAQTLRAVGADRTVDEDKEQGFYFRIPGQARVKVVVAGKTGDNPVEDVVVEDQKTVAQLGLVTALPRQRSVYTKYDIGLYEQSGALQTLTTDTEGVDTASVTGVLDAAKTVVDADIKAEQADKAASDELARLERERKILEERKKIQELRTALGLGDN